MLAAHQEHQIPIDKGAAHNVAGQADMVRRDAVAPTGVNIYLRPLAFPSCLGMASFFMASWIFGSYMTDWWGTSNSPLIAFPFISILGAVQLLSASKAYQARDTLATLFHGSWGAFYLAYGIWAFTNLIIAFTLTTVPISGPLDNRGGGLNFWNGFSEFAMTMAVLMTVSLVCTMGALTRDVATLLTFAFTSLGSFFLMVGWFKSGGSMGLVKTGGYFMCFAAMAAIWRAAGYIADENFDRRFIPVWNFMHSFRKPQVQVPIGEPGVRKGQ